MKSKNFSTVKAATGWRCVQRTVIDTDTTHHNRSVVDVPAASRGLVDT